MKLTIDGDVTLLCCALELAASEYARYAREVRAGEKGHERVAEQFERQARGVDAMLKQAYDARDA